MEVKMSLLLFIMAVMMKNAFSMTLVTNEGNRTTYDTNNPYAFPVKKALYFSFGVILDLYKTDNEVRNLVVPIYGYKENNFEIPIAAKHPPIFFNMYKDGNCLGQFVMKNLTVHKINDGRDSTFELPDTNTSDDDYEDYGTIVYIGAADGIYKYDMNTEAVAKYGTVTEDIIAIDKVVGVDEFYIVNADHKVHKVINHGTEVVPIEAISYAKDIALDWFANIYFIGEDDVPQVLIKGENVPHKFVEFNFDIVRPVLGRQVMNVLHAKKEILIPFLVDGVLYALENKNSEAVGTMGIVPGVTAFSAEFPFVQYYAVDSLIYEHSLFGREVTEHDLNEAEPEEQSSPENEVENERPVEVFDRDARAGYKRFKKLKRKH